MYKYIPIKYGDESQAVLDYQNRLIELGYDKYYDSKDKKTYTLIPSNYYGDGCRAITENLLAKLVDSISIEWVMSKFPDAKPQWFEINGNFVTPALGAYLEHAEELSKWYNQELPKYEIEIPENPQSKLEQFVNAILKFAKGEIGVREKGSTNTGVRVNEYQLIGSCGQVKHGGCAWCDFWCKFIYRYGAIIPLKLKDLLPCDGYTPNTKLFGLKNNIAIKNPKLSELILSSQFLIYGSARGDAIHTGIIAGTKNGQVITIEGNTNASGSADGGGVEQRIRPLSQIWYQIAAPMLYG